MSGLIAPWTIRGVVTLSSPAWAHCARCTGCYSINMGHVLAKLGNRRYMKELVEDGRLLLKQLQYYTDLENEAQGDPDEGLMARYTDENPTLKMIAKVGDKTFPLKVKRVRISSSARRHGVYCMYAIDSSDVPNGQLSQDAVRQVIEDKNLAKFGYDTLVLIKNSPEFVRRMNRAAWAAGYELEHDLIEYMPSDYCGDMGPFRKLDKYKYQNEARFLTTKPVPGDVFLKLGPLWDVVFGWCELPLRH